MYGYVRVGASSTKLIVGDCNYNIDEIIRVTKEAYEKGVKILTFAELCITGYSCGDLVYQKALVNSCNNALLKFIEETKNMDMVSILGIPVHADNQIFNCVAVIHKGTIKGIITKTYLPGYNEFSEERWFSEASKLISTEIEFCGQTVPIGSDILFNCDNDIVFGVEICHDLWTPIPPSTYQALSGANIIFNLSASNEVMGKSSTRRQVVSEQSRRIIGAYVYCSAGMHESTTDTVFSGHNIISENGEILTEREPLSKESELVYTDIDVEKLMQTRRRINSFMEFNDKKVFRQIKVSLNTETQGKLCYEVSKNPFLPESADDVLKIQYTALAKRLLHTNIENTVIAVSGGLDSTMALLVMAKTYDFLNISRKNILGVTMPGFGTTGRTYQNALKLMDLLGISYKEIDIKPACIQHFKDIGHDINNHDVVFENVQARERTQIVMNIANGVNGLLVGTGNLSELALGFATYGGDHLSMYNVNVGLPKTLIRKMFEEFSEVDYFGKEISNILLDILNTPVSPELLPTGEFGELLQLTEKVVGPYELNDFFLYYMLKYGFSPKKIVYLAEHAFFEEYSKDEITKWLKLFYKRFFNSQFKRSCMPDGPKVIPISLSPRGDFKMPSDASYSIWIKELEL